MKSFERYIISAILALTVFAGCDKEPVEQVLLEIDRTNMKMTVGQNQKLNAVLKGAEGDFIWESDSPEVAEVDADGVVYAVSAGKANIVVSSQNLTKTCAVEVVDFKAAKLELNDDFTKEGANSYSYLVLKGEALTLNPKFYNIDGEKVNEMAYPKYVITSSNPSKPDETVITVDENGVVEAVNPGYATVKISGAGLEALVALTVKSLELNATEMTMFVNQSNFLEAKIYPENLPESEMNVEWSSSSVEYVKVNNLGALTAIKETTEPVIVSAKCGALTAECKVSVINFSIDKIIFSNLDEIKLPEEDCYQMRVDDRYDVAVKFMKNEEDVTDMVKALSVVVEYKSSNEKVATINDGYIIAKGIGETEITVKCGEVTSSFKLTVIEGEASTVDPEEIKIEFAKNDFQYNADDIPVEIKSFNLKIVVVRPEECQLAKVRWSSSNEEVATVNDEGQVSILKAGSVTITAKALSADGLRELDDVTASIDLAFIAPVITEVLVTLPRSMVEVGESIQLGYKVIPSEAEPENVSWVMESGNDLASITSSGVITGVKAEKVTDAVTGYSSWKTVTVKVTVDGVSATGEVAIIPRQPSDIEVDLPQNSKMRINEQWNFNPRIVPNDLSGFSVGVYGMRPTGGVAMPNGAYAPFEPPTPGSYSLTFYTESNDDLVYQRQKNVVINVYPYWVESITLPATKELAIGSTSTLLPTFTSDVAGVEPTDKTLTWTSSNESVATVDNSGRVTAKAAGVVEITATTTGSWSVPSADQRKSATCKITVVVPSSPVYVGDYVYTDGTWSTQLDKSKTVAGVVFALTDATASDPKLSAAYSGCTHGLAMSVTEYESAIKMSGSTYTWQDVYNYAVSKGGYVDMMETGLVCGYSNTAAMKAFKTEKGEYSVYLDKLAEQDAVKVAGASAWYMPSVYEMSLISKNFDALNAVLSTAGKTQLEAYKSSWTGSEYQGTYWHSTWGGLNNQAPAWGLSINAKAGNGNMMMTNVYPVRFVFAF